MQSTIEFPSQRSNLNPDLDLYLCLLRSELGARLVPSEYERGAQLCSEGEPAEGIFSIHTGQAKEFLTSPAGKSAIIRILYPGDIIGLEAVMGDSLYQTTVEAIEPATAHFVPTRELLNSMRSDEHLRLAVARQLSNHCRYAYKEIRQFGSAVAARVARFLFNVERETVSRGRKADNVCISLTREEIAQSIGSSRETVSRIVTYLQRKRWILINGKQWRIQNRQRLAAMATEHQGFATGKLWFYPA